MLLREFAEACAPAGFVGLRAVCSPALARSGLAARGRRPRDPIRLIVAVEPSGCCLPAAGCWAESGLELLQTTYGDHELGCFLTSRLLAFHCQVSFLP